MPVQKPIICQSGCYNIATHYLKEENIYLCADWVCCHLDFELPGIPVKIENLKK